MVNASSKTARRTLPTRKCCRHDRTVWCAPVDSSLHVSRSHTHGPRAETRDMQRGAESTCLLPQHACICTDDDRPRLGTAKLRVNTCAVPPNAKLPFPAPLLAILARHTTCIHTQAPKAASLDLARKGVTRARVRTCVQQPQGCEPAADLADQEQRQRHLRHSSPTELGHHTQASILMKQPKPAADLPREHDLLAGNHPVDEACRSHNPSASRRANSRTRARSAPAAYRGPC
jgi:hypothetical protein